MDTAMLNLLKTLDRLPILFAPTNLPSCLPASISVTRPRLMELPQAIQRMLPSLPELRWTKWKQNRLTPGTPYRRDLSTMLP